MYCDVIAWNHLPNFSKCCIVFITLSFPIFITDIPLLPSISSLNSVDVEEPGGPFTVHWLNNKELHFALAMEVFLQQLQGCLEQQNERSQEGTEKYLELALKLYLNQNLRFTHCIMLCLSL